MSAPQNRIAEDLVLLAALRQFDQILVLNPATSAYVLYELVNDGIADTRCGSYDELLISFTGLLPKPERPQFMRAAELSAVQGALAGVSSYTVSVRTAEEQYYKLTFCYSDEARRSILITRQNETFYAKELRMAEERLRWDNVRFQFLLEHVCEGFIEIDPRTGACCSLTPKRESDTKTTLREQVDWIAENLIVDSQRAAYIQDFALDALLASLRRNNGTYTVQYDVMHSDGRHTLRISNVLLPVPGRSNEECIFSYTQDITDLRQQEEKNERLVDISQQLLNLSQTEPMTGLYNRTASEKLIGEHLAKESSGCYGTLLLLDIDHFKDCNDVHGHQTGDHVLRYLSRSMREVFRSDDILCRWGGDEFLVFMRNMGNMKSIEGRLARLREKMRACTTKEGEPLPVTLSAGGVVAASKSTLTELFMEADHSLYNVKKCGRDGALIAKYKRSGG